jgi:hypothetical protein
MSLLAKTAFAALLSIGIALPASAAGARGGPLGLGIVLGEPTGFTGKLRQGPANSIDFGLAWALSDYFLLYSDYLWEFPGGFGRSTPFVSQLSPYIGLGGILAFSTNDNWREDRKFFGHHDSSIGLGVRIPLGIAWNVPTAPLEVFLELVPGIAIIPGTDAFLQAGIGVRYFF